MAKAPSSQEVLILTNVWTGATPFFYEGRKESKGMPAFNNVFFRLIDDSRISKLHIIIWQPEREIKIPSEYSDKIFCYIVPKRKTSLFNNLKLVFMTSILGKRIINKHKNIRNIIGFGSLGGITSIIGKLTNIPDFRRVYGTFLINEINNSKLSIFTKHPLEYLTFSTRGKGLLVTNDRTKADLVYKKIGNKKLPFYFPLNGIDKEIVNNLHPPGFTVEKEYMTYVARLDPWKRQHLLLLALSELQKKGIDFPKTYIIGSIFDEGYTKELKKIINDNNLDKKVEFVYGMPIHQVHYMLYNSKLTFSLYHTSNLGNVFIESMQLGVPMLAINDTGSLNLIDNNAYFELKNDEIPGIANAITTVLHDDKKILSLKNNAVLFADKNILSWDERVGFEIDLMLD